MNYFFSAVKYAFILLFIVSGTSQSFAYDQVFPSVKLRHGEAYYFNDTFNNKTNYQNYLQNFNVSFTEGGDYNGGANPSFQWTSEIKAMSYYIPAKTSVKVVQSNPDYYFIKYKPVTRKSDNLSIVYTIHYWEKPGSTWIDMGSHTEYQPYTITWCGDGIRDDYIDQYNGKVVKEICEPNDPAKVGWGTGGCSNICQPITKPPVTTCDNLSANPTLGNAPLLSNFSCSATNASSYQLKITKSGSLVSTINSNSGNYNFTQAGTYQVQCFVDGTITSPACIKTVKVNTPPPAPSCDSLVVNPNSGNTGLTSTFDCNGTSASSYQVLIKKGASTVKTFNVKSGSYTFSNSGSYQVQCLVNGTITSPACSKPVTIVDQPPKTYDLALQKKLVGSKNIFKQGDEVSFQISVKNQGEVEANNIQVTDYIPAGFTVKGAIWNVAGNKATLDFGKIPVATTKTNTITLIIGTGALTGVTRNYAEISLDDGNDCDSTPDNINGNQSGETDATGMMNDDIGTGCDVGGDEDDHDYEEITVEPTVVPVYDLALRKTLSATTPGPFSSGSTVVFNIEVFNQGNVTANNIEVSDYIPTGLTLNDSSWIKTGSIAKKVITKIDAGKSVVITIQFKIAAYAPSSITNYAEISKDDGNDCDSTPDSIVDNDGVVIDNNIGTGCDIGGDEDDHDPETITTNTPPVYDLALRKTLSATTPGPFNSGSTVTFNIEVLNQGNVPANGIQVTDYIPFGLILSDTDWIKSGNLAQRVISHIDAGSSVMVAITFKIAANAPSSIINYAEISSDDGNDCDSIPDAINSNQVGETLATGMVDNAIGTGCDVGGDEDDHDLETIPTTNPSIYDLALRKTLSATTQGPFNTGSIVKFNIEVFNQGNIPANNIEVTDYIPTGFTLNDSAWTQSGTLAKRVISHIDAGSSVMVAITFKIAANAPSSITNYAEISSDDGNDCDSIPDAMNGNQTGETITGGMIDNAIGTGCDVGGDEDDHDLETIVIGNPNSDVYLIKSLAPDQPEVVNPGDRVHYIITVVNSGSTAATNLKVEDHFPANLILDDTNWNLVTGEIRVARYKTNIVSLAAGAQIKFDIYFKIAAGVTGSVRNNAVVCEEGDVICPIEPPDVCDDITEVGTLDGCVEIIVASCLSLNSIPSSAQTSLTTQLTCSGKAEKNIYSASGVLLGTQPVPIPYKIEVKNASGVIVKTFNTQSGSVTLPLIGGVDTNYTASCYVNNTTTTPAVCQKTLSVTKNPPVSACTSLTATKTSDVTSLNTTLTCTGSGATSYKIEVKNPSGSIVQTFNTQSGSVTLPLIGGYATTYKASCYVNNETTTSTDCQKDLSVTPPGGSSGGYATCSSATKSGSTVTCMGNEDTRSAYLKCGFTTLGPINTTPIGGGQKADFTCNESAYQCYVFEKPQSNTTSAQWKTGKECTQEGGGGSSSGGSSSGGGGCGNAILETSLGEQCDFGSARNGIGNNLCTATCQLKCSATDTNCITTIPNGGDMTFGPKGTIILGHNMQALVEKGEKPYYYNNSDYDIAIDKLCIITSTQAIDTSKYPGDVVSGSEQCMAVPNGKVFAYSRVEFPTIPTNYPTNKANIPAGKSFGTENIVTSMELAGRKYYNAYFAGKLEVRVAKPAVTTIGGGTSYVSSTTTGDLKKVTTGVTGYQNNSNFVGTSVNSGSTTISSYSNSSNNTSAVTHANNDTSYTQTVATTVTGATVTSGTTITKFEDKYNGLSNVFIVKGKNVTLSSFIAPTDATTYIVEGGNLTINSNIVSSKNIAFIVKGGNIIIDKNVKQLDGSYVAIPVSGVGGQIRSNGETATQLVVKGSLYGDISQLVESRYYVSSKSSLLSVGTIVSFGSSIFYKPAPLLGQFIGEYLDTTKVAK